MCRLFLLCGTKDGGLDTPKNPKQPKKKEFTIHLLFEKVFFSKKSNPAKKMSIPFPDGSYHWGTSDGKLMCRVCIRNGSIVETTWPTTLHTSLLFALTSGETSTSPGAGRYFLHAIQK